MARRVRSLLRLDAVRVEGAIIQPDVLASAASGTAEGQSTDIASSRSEIAMARRHESADSTQNDKRKCVSAGPACRRPDYVLVDGPARNARFVGLRTATEPALLHNSRPSVLLGGVGESALGACHGKCGFDRFSHLKATPRRPFEASTAFVMLPYGRPA